jgi:prepilin-type processing-associated H-X9-DG protein
MITMRRSVTFWSWAGLSCVFVLIAPAWGQEKRGAYDLSRAIPEKSLAYIGWSGCDADLPGGPTALRKLLAEPEVSAAIETLGPRLRKAVADLVAKENGQEAGKAFEHGYALFTLLRRHPVGFSVGQIVTQEAAPSVTAYLLVRAGDDAAAAQKHLEEILKLAGVEENAIQTTTVGDVEMKVFSPLGNGMPIRWGAVGGDFVVTLGANAAETLLAAIKGEAKSLSANPRFAAAMRPAGGAGGYFTFYLDVRSGLDTLSTFQPMLALTGMPVLGDTRTYRKILKDTGLANVEALTMTWHPEAGGFMVRSFVYAPRPTDAPATQPAEEPVSERDLSLVPADASWAWVGSFDLAATYEGALGLAHAVSPSFSRDLDEGIAGLEKALGLRIHDDLLAPIGAKWVICDAPGNGGLWITGITATVELRSAERFDKGLTQLIGAIAEQTKGAVSIEEETYRGHTIRFVNAIGAPLPIAPAWSIQGKRAIIACYPQMVRTAIDRALDKAPSILSNPDFQRGYKLMPKDAISVSYVDTVKGVGDVYSIVLPVAQVLVAMGQKEGVPITIAALPSSRTLTKHLFGTVSASVRTDDGLLGVSHGALPIAVPSIGGAGGFTMPLMVSILLPSLARAREQAKRAVSAANLKGIGTACLTYAEENQGKLPPDLETLVKDNAISEKQRVSPRGKPGEVSYIYIGAGQKNTQDPRNIVAYEKPEYSDGEGTNVLFLDGHVKWMDMDAFKTALEETSERLGRGSPPAGVKE